MVKEDLGPELCDRWEDGQGLSWSFACTRWSGRLVNNTRAGVAVQLRERIKLTGKHAMSNGNLQESA